MEKSLYTAQYAVLRELLKETRKGAGITQADMAQRLEAGQSFVSKYERGEVRLDLIQVRTICREMGTTLPEFIERLEVRLKESRPRKPSTAERKRPSQK